MKILFQLLSKKDSYVFGNDLVDDYLYNTSASKMAGLSQDQWKKSKENPAHSNQGEVQLNNPVSQFVQATLGAVKRNYWDPLFEEKPKVKKYQDSYDIQELRTEKDKAHTYGVYDLTHVPLQRFSGQGNAPTDFVFGNSFIQSDGRNVKTAKEFSDIAKNDSTYMLTSGGFPISNARKWMGIVDDKLKVGQLSDFDDSQVVTPVYTSSKVSPLTYFFKGNEDNEASQDSIHNADIYRNLLTRTKESYNDHHDEVQKFVFNKIQDIFRKYGIEPEIKRDWRNADYHFENRTLYLLEDLLEGGKNPYNLQFFKKEMDKFYNNGIGMTFNGSSPFENDIPEGAKKEFYKLWMDMFDVLPNSNLAQELHNVNKYEGLFDDYSEAQPKKNTLDQFVSQHPTATGKVLLYPSDADKNYGLMLVDNSPDVRNFSDFEAHKIDSFIKAHNNEVYPILLDNGSYYRINKNLSDYMNGNYDRKIDNYFIMGNKKK